MGNKPKKEIEVLVRAIIQYKGKVLVCRKIGRKYYFLPGGHTEFGEDLKKALTREIKEELGLVVKNCYFIGSTEHIFTEDKIKHHEINLVFRVPIKKIRTESMEGHLEFFLFNKKQLNKEKVLPLSLKRAILRWLKDKKTFWVNEI